MWLYAGAAQMKHLQGIRICKASTSPPQPLSAMPVSRFPGVGFAPILMWLVVPLLVLWIVRRQIEKS